MDYRILTVEDAIPLLLDRSISPVVSLDTEWDIETGNLRGMSMAGGTPETGFFGCFWSFEQPYQQMPWAVVFSTVIVPIFGDLERTVVMHPINVDIKKLRERGLTDALTLCSLEDTVAMSYIYDDNLPHGLKPLAYCILLQTKATSHAATLREITGIRKQGYTLVKQLKGMVWEHYLEHRKKSDQVEAVIDPSWPGWVRLAMSLPPGMNKTVPKSWKCGGKTGCAYKNVVDASSLGLANLSAKFACAQCGKERKVTLGVQNHVEPILAEVINADFSQRAHDRYAQYGAEDAIYTLMIRYKLKVTFNVLQLRHLDMETRVTHPCVTEMEERGLKIDIPLLEDIHDGMRVTLDALRVEVIEAWTCPTDEKEFNPGSPDQVAMRLWLDWKLSPPAWAKDRRTGGIKKKHRRNKDGLCSADALILEAVQKKYEGTRFGYAIKILRDLRRWEKLFGTYVAPILHMAKNDPDGRIHSSFWPTGARSGRFSSSDPNVENIPRPFTMPTIDVDKAAQLFPGYAVDKPPRGFVLVTNKDKAVTHWRVCSLREIFIPPDKFVYVSADLSQIENRIAAFESRDPSMLKLYREWDCAECGGHGAHNVILHECPQCGAAEGKRDKSKGDQPVVKGFVHGKDIHSATASYLGFFEKYGKDGRQQAKPVNHGATYAMGANTFSKKEGVSVKDAADRLQRWHQTYPLVRGSLDRALPGTLHHRVAEDITQNGEVVMFDGHKRRFHAQRLLMRSGNFRPWEWEGTIREGVNVKMQGGTGVGMKRAMLRIREEIYKRGWQDRVFLVNQVHDELLYECVKELAKEFLALMIGIMESSFPELDVPVAADGGTGSTWGQAH